jgi:hypothetical protein
MGTVFHDHPRKKTIREKWDTPLLQRLHERWNTKFFYCGLPGPEAIDIKLWKDMISRVIAFEVECSNGDPRKNIAELGKQLALLGVRHNVFFGPIEEGILREEDWDGKPFKCDELVTLYNLDFCGSITGPVTTAGGKKRLRFEALMKIASLQRELYRRHGASRFVLLLTVLDVFDVGPVKKRFKDRNLPQATLPFAKMADAINKNSAQLHRNTDLLKAFVFTCMSDYLRGQNILSVFLPPVAYIGSTTSSPMLHFVVVCKMGPQDSPLGDMEQSAQEFFGLATIRATDAAIVSEKPGTRRLGDELDPVAFISNYTIAT